jgi:hypothetical protein
MPGRPGNYAVVPCPGVCHVTIAIGYGLVVLAFLGVRRHLREVGEERWSVLALPPIVLGSTLFVILTGMEIALGAVAETGGDAEAVQAALFPWFVPILLAGGVGFALGAFGFAMGIARSAVLRPGLTRVVAGALLAMALARFVPLSVAPTCWRRPASWRCGRWHMRCGGTQRCDPRDTRDRCRRPDEPYCCGTATGRARIGQRENRPESPASA